MDDIKQKQLDALLRHIGLVRNNCQLLAERLIEKGEEELGIKLIANSLIHDNSKFFGLEWLFLNAESKEKQPELFKLASEHHTSSNPHHPEFHCGGIKSMPQLYLAEMVADWKSRSDEVGDDIHEWIRVKASKRYKYTPNSKVYQDIKKYLEMILEKPFK